MPVRAFVDEMYKGLVSGRDQIIIGSIGLTGNSNEIVRQKEGRFSEFGKDDERRTPKFSQRFVVLTNLSFFTAPAFEDIKLSCNSQQSQHKCAIDVTCTSSL